LKEISSSDEKGGLRRKWFSDANWDLIVWLSGPGEIWGFQLCYDRARDERALTWTRETGYSHDRIDDGEGNPTKNRTPVLVPNGVFPALDRKQVPYGRDELTALATECTLKEDGAQKVERMVRKAAAALLLSKRIGEEFDGLISGVTDFGIFVELSEVHVDGLVHITALGNDYFRFEPKHHRLMGERTRQVFRLGDKVRVRVVRVDLDEAKIDFELVGVATGAVERGMRKEGGKDRGEKRHAQGHHGQKRTGKKKRR